jgi:peptidoglycan/xylan/chitin deacetylase (PgdA/CDA1 family)
MGSSPLDDFVLDARARYVGPKTSKLGGSLMRSGEFICLMYHDLGDLPEQAGRIDFGHAPYVVSGSAFARQMSYLRAQGLRACTVTEALQGGRGAVALTFDDGTSSDIEQAAPALVYARFSATFYVVTSRVGTNGYLTRFDLQYMSALGFEIGSHSVNHAFLPGLARHELERELRDSKDQLEQWIGSPVAHFSCPFGGRTPAVIAAGMEAGYKSVATSDIGVNRIGEAVLQRLAVRRNTSLYNFARMCAGETLLYPRVRQTVLSGVKSMIGFSAFSLVSRLVPRGQTPAPAAAKVRSERAPSQRLETVKGRLAA